MKAVLDLVRSRYQGTLSKTTTSINKLIYKRTLDEIKRVLSQPPSDEIPS
ncbi:MAG: hypothetical protein LBD75_04150 [Candidatus Peribacteria bacterium]|nr:hypothetical protein [Candidatus Peribacteria bacterium]